ncbi:hypothetical protein BH18ACI5_BH18ACI5_13410 [soil metagenome]
MQAHEYRARHFEMMAAIARQLAQHNAQLLEHSYDYRHFGSWWFTCSCREHYYRCVFDGHEGEIRLEWAPLPDGQPWNFVISGKTNDADEAEIALRILEAIGAT